MRTQEIYGVVAIVESGERTITIRNYVVGKDAAIAHAKRLFTDCFTTAAATNTGTVTIYTPVLDVEQVLQCGPNAPVMGRIMRYPFNRHATGWLAPLPSFV